MADKTKEQIITKIQKLLALAGNSAATPAEAARAAAQAEKMMRKYNIDEAETMLEEVKLEENFTREFAEEDDTWQSNRYPAWMGSLAVRIAGVYECKTRYQYNYAAGPGCVSITFFGTKTDVAIAKYTYTYLVREINRLTEKYWESAKLQAKIEGIPSKLAKSSFRQGAAVEIDHLLVKIQQEKEAEMKAPSSGTALVVVDAKASMIEKLYGSFTYRERERADVDARAFRAGRIAGESVSLRKGVETN